MSARNKGGKPKGSTKLKVCERRANEWKDYARGMTPKDLAKKYGVTKRTIETDIATMRDEVMAQIKEQASHDAAARALSVYYLVLNKAIEVMEEAENEPDPKARYQGIRAMLGEMRGAQRDMDSLLVKAGFYEGGKAGVTVNLFQGLDQSQWEDVTPGLLEHLAGDKEDAQAMLDYLWQKGYRPAIEGECTIKEDNDEKPRLKQE